MASEGPNEIDNVGFDRCAGTVSQQCRPCRNGAGNPRDDTVVEWKGYFVRSEVSDAAGNSRTMFLPAPDGGLGGGCVNPASAAEMAAGQGDMSAEYMSWFMESAELIGEESVDDTDAWQLRANDIDRAQTLSSEDMSISAMTMWLSKDRYLPLKMRMEGTVNVDSQSRPVTIEVLTSDFRAVRAGAGAVPGGRQHRGITTGIDEVRSPR